MQRPATKLATALATLLSAFGGTSWAQTDIDEITVAYFLESPTPSQFAQHNGLYAEALGVPVNWISFDAGTAMSAAMASGDVDIAYGQGVTPFLLATAAGQDLRAVDIALTYSDNDNCVVRAELGITQDNATAALPGLQVGLPFGTAAHSGFLAQMAHFGVDTNAMTLVDMAPVDAAEAFASGQLDMACGWFGALRRMKQHGNVLLEGAEKEAVVGPLFDVVTIRAAFGDAHPELVAGFLKVTAQMEARFRTDPDPMMADIAEAAGMSAEAAADTMAELGFPTPAEKLSEDWMAGGLQRYLAESTARLQAAGQLRALPDDGPTIDPSYLEAASGD